jgi:hypothetical protein
MINNNTGLISDGAGMEGNLQYRVHFELCEIEHFMVVLMIIAKT